MNKRRPSALTIQYSVFITRRFRRTRATALIETAIVLPLYMILLLAMVYFGFATLGRQRQDKATAYAAWSSTAQNGGPTAAALLTAFWGNPQPQYTSFSVYGGGSNGQQEWVRQGDEYYGMEKYVNAQGATQWILPGNPNYNTQYNYSDDITGNVVVPVPYQLTGNPSFHQISNGGGYFFDSERVTVDLWNYALGTVTQSFNWTPGGIQPQFNISYTDFSNYLNPDSNVNQQIHGGVLLADANDPPSQPEAASGPPWPAWPQACGGMLAAALSGPPGVGQPQQWLERRTVESTMSYNPPLLNAFWGQPGDQAPTFGTYVTNGYTSQMNPPTTAIMDADVTVRNSSVMRYGAEEGQGQQTPATFLSGVGQFLGQGQPDQPPPDATTVLDASNHTIQYWWTPN